MRFSTTIQREGMTNVVDSDVHSNGDSNVAGGLQSNAKSGARNAPARAGRGKDAGSGKRSSSGGFQLGDFNPQESLSAFLEANWIGVLALLSVVAVASMGFAAYDYWGRRTESKAEEALYKAQAPFIKKKEEFERARMKALMPGFAGLDEPNSATGRPPTGDLAKDYGSSVAELEQALAQHPKTRAGQQAAIDLVSLYLDYKQPEKALAAAEKAAPSAAAKDVMGALFLIALGDARAANGRCDSAIDAWNVILSEPRAAYLHAEATVKEGLCLESMKQPERAAELYRKATTDFGDSSAGQTAKSLLRALEMKTAPAKAG